MPQWRTRIVGLATTLLLVAVSLGGGWLNVVHQLYLDW
jgi:hypothetical protein